MLALIDTRDDTVVEFKPVHVPGTTYTPAGLMAIAKRQAMLLNRKRRFSWLVWQVTD